METHNVAILNIRYNCIDKNKQVVGNWVHMRNTNFFSNYGLPKIRVVVL